MYNAIHSGKSNVFTIYKITNILNGKVYIGFDSAFPKRINQHLSEAKTGKQSPLCNDLRYYGERVGINNSFIFECLYQSKDPIHCLKMMEPWFIEHYNSHYELGNGYNMTFGGEGMISPRMIKITNRIRKKQQRKIKTVKKVEERKNTRDEQYIAYIKKLDAKKARKTKRRERLMMEKGPFVFDVKIPPKYFIA